MATWDIGSVYVSETEASDCSVKVWFSGSKYSSQGLQPRGLINREDRFSWEDCCA